jgi:LPS export ABC transporter protein LptC
MRVVPKQGRASTEGPVTIEEPRGIIRAVGMELDNQAHTLKLKSAVRGTLQPHVADPLAKQ